ncbi:MAG: hypothetical protein HQL97_14690 [Magnetococcales bacterium]|nr:hypothetical protein [Magnetococcales bacterium]
MAKPWGDYFGHAARQCSECDQLFYPKQGWEKICWPCWREARGEQEAEPKSPSREPQVVFCSDPRLPDLDEWQAMIMPLIKHCHPDKHGGSREANDVTRWLIDQRERLPPG